VLLLASPAAAELITISEGHYPRVNLNAERELLFTGGSIEFLNNVGGVATIDGGTLTGTFETRSRSIRGGTTYFLGSGTPHIQKFESEADQPGLVNRTIVEGKYFRVSGGNDRTSLGIEGVMLDGSFLHLSFLAIARPQYRDLNYLEFITHPELVTDPTGDGLFNLEDLNVVRNNFGAQADRSSGDIDGDGTVGLGDLNHVRDNFSTANYVFYGPEHEFSGVWNFSPQSVPEPSTLILGLLALTTVCFRIACK